MHAIWRGCHLLLERTVMLVSMLSPALHQLVASAGGFTAMLLTPVKLRYEWLHVRNFLIWLVNGQCETYI